MSEKMTTILVAVDPSNAGKGAFRQALRLAQFLKADLIAHSVTPRYEGNMHRWKIQDADTQLNQPFAQCLNEMQEIAAAQGRTVRTIHAIGVGHQRMHARLPVQRKRTGQQGLHIAATASAATHGDGGFTPRQQHTRGSNRLPVPHHL